MAGEIPVGNRQRWEIFSLLAPSLFLFCFWPLRHVLLARGFHNESMRFAFFKRAFSFEIVLVYVFFFELWKGRTDWLTDWLTDTVCWALFSLPTRAQLSCFSLLKVLSMDPESSSWVCDLSLSYDISPHPICVPSTKSLIFHLINFLWSSGMFFNLTFFPFLSFVII